MAFQVAEKKALSLITCLYIVRMLGLFMVLPIISVYGDQLTGATPFLLGLALGIYGLSQAILQIPFGRMSDKFGRKPMLVIGFLLFCLGSWLCSVSNSIEMLLLGRALQGAGAVSAVLLALVADSIEEKNRTISMAVIGISIGVSFGLSVVLGPVIAATYQIQGVFLFSLVLGFLALLLVLFLVPSTSNSVEHMRTGSNRSSLSSVLFDPDLFRLDFSIFSLHFLQMCIWVVVPGVMVSELNLAAESHWVVYLIVVGGGFILMAPFLRMWDRQGKVKLSMQIATGVLLLALILMSQVDHFYLFMLGLLLFFWGFNLLEATLPSAVTKVANADAKGTATGVYSTYQFAGVFFGGAFGGWLLSVYTPVVVFYVAAVLAVLWLTLLCFWRKEPRAIQ